MVQVRPLMPRFFLGILEYVIFLRELFRQIAKERGISVVSLSKLTSINHEIDLLIDERTKKEAEKGDVIIDGILAGWMAKNFADIKFHLIAPMITRIERIARRDRIPYDEAKEATLLREKIERERFKKIYGIDIDDNSIYDLVLNTGLLPLEVNILFVKKFIQEFVKYHGEN